MPAGASACLPPLAVLPHTDTAPLAVSAAKALRLRNSSPVTPKALGPPRLVPVAGRWPGSVLLAVTSSWSNCIVLPAALLAVTFTYGSTEVPMPSLPLMTPVVVSRLRPGGSTPLVPITRFLMVWKLLLLAPVVPVKLNAHNDLSVVCQLL